MGMSQMCTGAGDYFRTSKPHSEKLCNNTVNICAPLRHKKVCSTEIVPRLCPCWLLAQGRALLVHYKSGPGWAKLYSTLRNNYAKIDHLYTTCQSPAANSISSYQHAINHTGEMWKPSTPTV